jgi:N-glycosylase/DNA lyase
MKLYIPDCFDLASTLESGQAHRWKYENGWYWGVIYGDLIKIRQSKSGLEIFSSLGDLEKLKSLIHCYFRMDDDLDEIYEIIRKDDYISGAIDRHYGLRILRQEPWECLCAFICSATSSIVRIHKNMESISDAFGKSLVLDGHRRSTFPTPEQISASGEDKLRELGLGFRAKYLHCASIAIAEGSLDLGELRNLDYWDAKIELMKLSGIGPKIADCVLIFSLDKLEAFPIDRWVSRALEKFYFDDGAPNYQDTVEWAHDYFGCYAGYAQQYLFHDQRLGGLHVNGVRHRK